MLDDSEGKWQKTLDIDLRSVIVGVTIAASEARREKLNKEAKASRKNSTKKLAMAIVVVASAGGLYPMPSAPVYAAAKGGLVHFVRSAARGILEGTGARLTALCPEQVDTALVAGVTDAGLLPGVEKGGKLAQLLTTDDVADAAVALGEDERAVGTALMVHVSGKLLEAKMPRGFLVDSGGRFSLKSSSSSSNSSPSPSSSSLARAAWSRSLPPSTNRAVVVQRSGTDFRAATEVVERPIKGLKPPPGFLLVRRAYAGVNASDGNFAAGRYAAAPGVASGSNSSIPGSKGARPPFPCGFEAVGIVAAVSDPESSENGESHESGSFRVGDAVAELCYDGFSEFSLARADRCFRVTNPDAASVALLTSGLTASIGLEVACKPRRGEVIVVTAAAGGTGQFVVQLAKAAGCRVVATCGGPAKAAMLKGLGAERVIDYRAEDVGAVLKREYPKVRKRRKEEKKKREKKKRESWKTKAKGKKNSKKTLPHLSQKNSSRASTSSGSPSAAPCSTLALAP